MRILEIGCGAGRVTRALAQYVGEVHAVDISAEMVRLAREALALFPNAHIYQNKGMDPAGGAGAGIRLRLLHHRVPARPITRHH